MAQTYTFRATVMIRVEHNAKGLARRDAQTIHDEIRKSLPTGVVILPLQ
jgi:hypothetical protein